MMLDPPNGVRRNERDDSQYACVLFRQVAPKDRLVMRDPVAELQQRIQVCDKPRAPRTSGKCPGKRRAPERRYVCTIWARPKKMDPIPERQFCHDPGASHGVAPFRDLVFCRLNAFSDLRIDGEKRGIVIPRRGKCESQLPVQSISENDLEHADGTEECGSDGNIPAVQVDRATEISRGRGQIDRQTVGAQCGLNGCSQSGIVRKEHQNQPNIDAVGPAGYSMAVCPRSHCRKVRVWGLALHLGCL